MKHHAYLVTGPQDAAREAALAFVEGELGLPAKGNPDVIEIRRGLFTVEDARELSSIASAAPLTGDAKAILIVASRIYHEAQNALLKHFEEPVAGTTLFLVLPGEGAVIGTLRSRVMALPGWDGGAQAISDEARAFLAADEKGRSARIERLAAAKDEVARREARDTALSILDGVERAVHAKWKKDGTDAAAALLSELQELRGYLMDRSSPVKMILEHLAIVLPPRSVP
ncbi:MAG: hypothetical protein KGI41_03100 [Patescibacteria group bacterium]|nr:hypothetical protein [Patescibacteria group bacterium]MDE1966202.1 hypothetical protein [Patescibacteria group bacterium]